MRDALSFERAVIKMETHLSGCKIPVPVFPPEWPSNFSRLSFRPKGKEPEWGWRLHAASSTRTVAPYREKVVKKAVRVLPFACPGPKAIKQTRHSFRWPAGGICLPSERSDGIFGAIHLWLHTKDSYVIPSPAAAGLRVTTLRVRNLLCKTASR